jgi:hypothetical protein
VTSDTEKHAAGQKWLASSHTHDAGKEERAYGAGALAYKARADAITTKGNAGKYPGAPAPAPTRAHPNTDAAPTPEPTPKTP